MKYYITKKNKEILSYKRVKFNADIEYKEDTLLFDDMKFALKFYYYYKDNQIEIMLKRKDLKSRSLIKDLLVMNQNIKWILPEKLKGKIVFAILIFYYTLLIKLKLVRKKPILIEQIEWENQNLYVCNNQVINGMTHSKIQNTTHFWTDQKKIPFENYEIINCDARIHEINDSEEIWFAEDFDYVIDNGILSQVKFRPLVYIYNVSVGEEETTIDVFYQNYMHLKSKPTVITDNEITIDDNFADAKYFSKKSLPYQQNFKRIIIKNSDEMKLNFMYNDKYMAVMLNRNVFNKQLINEYRVRKTRVSFYLEKISLPKDYLSREEQFVAIKKANVDREIYLFQDRPNKADDSAESLYRYYMNNNPGKELFYAIDKESKCYQRLEKEGFNLVDFGSDAHKEIYLSAEKLLTSHAARRIYDPFFPQKLHRSFETFKFVFLQHGMIMGNHHGFLDRINNKIDLFITSSNDEQELVKNFSDYDNVVVTGLARFDNYKENKRGKYLIYAPSWNTLYADNLAQSPYVQEIEKVINNSKIYQILKNNNVELKLILHPEIIDLDIELENKYNIEIVKANKLNYKRELSNCSGLITDYSSLFFDVLYQEKFVVHHQPYELHHQNDQVTNYLASIEQTANITELEKTIEEIAIRNWQMTKEQIGNLAKVFAKRDSENCQRICAEIEKMK